MATIKQVEKRIAKLMLELKDARSELARLEKARQEKACARPVSLEHCLKIYNHELEDAKRLVEITGQQKFALRIDRLVESRSYYKEICGHLLEGGKVKISIDNGWDRGKSLTFSNLHRFKWDPDFLMVNINDKADSWYPRRSRLKAILEVLENNRLAFDRPRRNLAIEFL